MPSLFNISCTKTQSTWSTPVECSPKTPQSSPSPALDRQLSYQIIVVVLGHYLENPSFTAPRVRLLHAVFLHWGLHHTGLYLFNQQTALWTQPRLSGEREESVNTHARTHTHTQSHYKTHVTGLYKLHSQPSVSTTFHCNQLEDVELKTSETIPARPPEDASHAKSLANEGE